MQVCRLSRFRWKRIAPDSGAPSEYTRKSLGWLFIHFKATKGSQNWTQRYVWCSAHRTPPNFDSCLRNRSQQQTNPHSSHGSQHLVIHLPKCKAPRKYKKCENVRPYRRFWAQSTHTSHTRFAQIRTFSIAHTISRCFPNKIIHARVRN